MWRSTATEEDKQIRDLFDETETALREVEAENPDAECGWEPDVIRSIVNMSDAPEGVKNEVLRMQGVVIDDLGWD